jgi:hypothetical protein
MKAIANKYSLPATQPIYFGKVPTSHFVQLLLVTLESLDRV